MNATGHQPAAGRPISCLPSVNSNGISSLTSNVVRFFKEQVATIFKGRLIEIFYQPRKEGDLSIEEFKRQLINTYGENIASSPKITVELANQNGLIKRTTISKEKQQAIHAEARKQLSADVRIEVAIQVRTNKELPIGEQTSAKDIEKLVELTVNELLNTELKNGLKEYSRTDIKTAITNVLYNKSSELVSEEVRNELQQRVSQYCFEALKTNPKDDENSSPSSDLIQLTNKLSSRIVDHLVQKANAGFYAFSSPTGTPADIQTAYQQVLQASSDAELFFYDLAADLAIQQNPKAAEEMKILKNTFDVLSQRSIRLNTPKASQQMHSLSPNQWKEKLTTAYSAVSNQLIKQFPNLHPDDRLTLLSMIFNDHSALLSILSKPSFDIDLHTLIDVKMKSFAKEVFLKQDGSQRIERKLQTFEKAHLESLELHYYRSFNLSPKELKELTQATLSPILKEIEENPLSFLPNSKNSSESLNKLIEKHCHTTIEPHLKMLENFNQSLQGAFSDLADINPEEMLILRQAFQSIINPYQPSSSSDFIDTVSHEIISNYVDFHKTFERNNMNAKERTDILQAAFDTTQQKNITSLSKEEYRKLFQHQFDVANKTFELIASKGSVRCLESLSSQALKNIVALSASNSPLVLETIAEMYTKLEKDIQPFVTNQLQKEMSSQKRSFSSYETKIHTEKLVQRTLANCLDPSFFKALQEHQQDPARYTATLNRICVITYNQYISGEKSGKSQGSSEIISKKDLGFSKEPNLERAMFRRKAPTPTQ